MNSKQTKKRPEENNNELTNRKCFLILHNDDVHSFDYVTNALIEICNHSFEQASQCTLITHYKGKCEIKKGGLSNLKPLKDALTDKKLNVTID